MSDLSPRFGRVPAACILAAVSGAAGLAHQMIWTRRLVDLLGASPLTFSKVVGAFFFGLAAGAALAAIRSNPVRNPWRRVAFVELSIAALALPVLFTPHVAELLYQSPRFGSWFKHLVPFLFVTPPAIAMGLVIPWMVRALSAHLPSVGNAAVWLYAANTLGGVVGIIGVLLFALPALGLTCSGLLVCGVNLMIAASALWFGSVLRDKSNALRQPQPANITRAPQSAIGNRQSPIIIALAFFSGFLVLSSEVVMQHQFAQITINSLFSSATVLVWVLLALAGGSALVPWLTKRFVDSNTLLRGILLCTALLCAVQPFVLTWLRDGVNILPYELPPGAYTLEVSKLGLITLCPMFLAAGLLFPLLLQSAAAGPGATTGRRVAVLLAWNGIGGWLGSEVAQHFIAPRFGLWQSIVLIGLGYCLLTLLIPENESARKKTPFMQSLRWLPIPAGVFIVATLAWAKSLPQVSVSPGERLAVLQVGREGLVATVECGPDDWRILFNNSYTLGGSRAKLNQERQAHLPILLHGHARSVGLLGVATGSTVAGAALHPGVEHIDAAELSPLVLQYAGEFFGPYNRDVFRDPRVRLFTEDARWMVATQKAAYDVIIGDLFLPWRTGEGRLFSVEHFEAVRHALKPDGVFCQWLPLFQLTRPQFEAITRTFQQVFPDVLLVRGDFYTELPILGLIGGRNLSEINWTQVSEQCAKLRANGQVTDPLARHKEGVAMLIVGMLPAPEDGPVNTLANAWLEWDCGRNILGMRTPWFIGVPQAEFVQHLHRTMQPAMPAELRSAHDSGQFFLTLEIAAKLELPVYENLFSQLKDRLPSALRDDREARWLEWPSRVKPHFELRGS